MKNVIRTNLHMTRACLVRANTLFFSDEIVVWQQSLHPSLWMKLNFIMFHNTVVHSAMQCEKAGKLRFIIGAFAPNVHPAAFASEFVGISRRPTARLGAGLGQGQDVGYGPSERRRISHAASELKKVRAPRWLATPDAVLENSSYWCAQGTPTYFCSATE